MEEPVTYPGDDFFLTAFYQLSSCRHSSDIIGPIPWDKIVQYSDRRELDYDVSLAFEHILREMDSEYLAWYQKKQKSRTKKG